MSEMGSSKLDDGLASTFIDGFSISDYGVYGKLDKESFGVLDGGQ